MNRIKNYYYIQIILVLLLIQKDTFSKDCDSKSSSSDIISSKDNSTLEVDQLFDPTQNCPDTPLSGQFCDAFTASAILSFITKDPTDPDFTPVIDVPAILKEDIYLKTIGPVTRRSLLDEPSLDPYYFDNDYISLSLQLFYNYTPKVFFTKNSPFINSYIDLTNKNIINELSTAQFRIGELTNQEIDIDIPGLLGLFNNIKLQQHRVGGMLGICKQWPKFVINYRIPFYYLLEHFFLTNQEIRAIENNPFFQANEKVPAISNKDEVNQFALKHLASDKYGFGDSRFNAALNFYESPCSELWAGVQVTIPTALLVQSGIIGGKFNPNANIPEFNIKKLFNLAFCFNEGTIQQNQAHRVIRETLNDFLIGTLDILSTILINAPLGNGRHWGIGPELNFRYQFSDCFGMHTYAAFESFASSNESRFFLACKNPADFDRNFRDEELAEQNLSFINTQITNTLYPKGVCIEVKPGYIVKARHSFLFDTCHWHGSLGFDYWLQNHETFGSIKSQAPELNLSKGLRASAQQGKLYGSVGYYGTALCHSIAWHVLLNADATVFNTGIGKNYTVVLCGGVDF